MKNKTVSKNLKAPNSRNRIQITPTERTRIILERYRELTGKSMASMISELLDESAPIMIETLELIERYKQKPTLAKDTLIAYADKADNTIGQYRTQIDDLFKPKKGRKPKARAE